MARYQSQPVASTQADRGLKSVTGVDADAPIQWPPNPTVTSTESEPRFLEQVQLYVDKAASKTDIPADMLKYIMACDNILRF